MRLWNFASAMSGQIKMMEQPCAQRRMWDTARVSSDLGWRGDRSNGPCSVLPIRFLSHSCLRPEEFCKDPFGFLQHPMAATTSCPSHARHLFTLASARSY